MTDEIQYGTSLITFDLEYADRKTLGIRVHPDKRVQVIAPLDTAKERVLQKLKSKARWILKQQEFFLSFHPLTPPRKYVSGETHLFLGKQYRLKLIESEVEEVKLLGGAITIFYKNKTDHNRHRKLLKAWHKEKAAIHFSSLFEKWLPITSSFYPDQANLDFRWMSKRWGSCNSNGDITLNIELIMASKKCIEYVIVHEFCHLAHLNHSKAFYDLLEKHYPKWRITKQQLEHFMV